MLEIIWKSIFYGFIGSRMAVMANDFMQYGSIFGGFKFWVARKLGFKTPINYRAMTLSVAYDKSVKYFDWLSNQSKIIALLDCKYCMTVWFCLFIGASGGLHTAFLTVIIGYLITEKI